MSIKPSGTHHSNQDSGHVTGIGGRHIALINMINYSKFPIGMRSKGESWSKVCMHTCVPAYISYCYDPVPYRKHLKGGRVYLILQSKEGYSLS